MNKTIDSRFVGTWKGCDDGKLTPEEINYWVMERHSNGTFQITFETHYADGAIMSSNETGAWFIADNLYWEHRASDDQTDVYLFHFITTTAVQFIETKHSDGNPYQFTDYKINVN